MLGATSCRPSWLAEFPGGAGAPNDAFTALKVKRTSWPDFTGLERNEEIVLLCHFTPGCWGRRRERKERVDVFGSASLGDWTALCLISLTCSEILGWLLSAASRRLGAELRFLGSLGGDCRLGFQPFLSASCQESPPSSRCECSAWLRALGSPSALSLRSFAAAPLLPAAPSCGHTAAVSARHVHPQEEFAAARHLSFLSVVAFASPCRAVPTRACAGGFVRAPG